MGSQSGYEYRYRVSLGDEFKQKEGFPVPPCRSYFLEVRTNFTLKPVPISPPAAAAEEILVATERFGNQLAVGNDDLPKNCEGSKPFELISGKNKVDCHLRGRLSHYRMPDAQIRSLSQTVFDFILDPRHDSLHKIPVLVAVDVCTVQMEGEPLDAAVDRSVIPDLMIPLQLRFTWKVPEYGISRDLQTYLRRLPLFRERDEDVDLRTYLRRLPVVRVREDVDVDIEMESCPICIPECVGIELGVLAFDKYVYHEKHSVGRKEGIDLMEACPICLREPIVGSKIASLPCKHAFHDHCIFRWLWMFKQLCPVCYVEIDFMTDYTKKKYFKKQEIQA